MSDIIDKMLDDGYIEVEREKVKEFGDPRDYCEGTGNCYLFEHQVTGEVECATCGAQFYLGTEEEPPEYFDFPQESEYEEYDHTPSVYEEVEKERKEEEEKKFKAIESKIDDLDFKLGVIIEFLNENVTVVNDNEEEGTTTPIVNIFNKGTKQHDIMEMLLDGPKTVEEIHSYLPKVKGKKMSVENLGKYIEKDMNLYSNFSIVNTFDGRYKIDETGVIEKV
jgi:uncharacterized Zn finger protein (UPF0148 family)